MAVRPVMPTANFPNCEHVEPCSAHSVRLHAGTMHDALSTVLHMQQNVYVHIEHSDLMLPSDLT